MKRIDLRDSKQRLLSNKKVNMGDIIICVGSRGGVLPGARADEN